MNLSIIIVSWNVREKLEENLKAIYTKTKNISFEVFVVDNNSADDSVQMVQKKFPQVELIANADNKGFAKANNQAIQKAKGDYVLLLNPDMRVEEGTLEKMVKFMQSRPRAGIAGCKLINEKGEIIHHARRWPRLADQLAIVLKLPHIFPSILDKYLMRDFDYSKEAVVDSIRGSFFMINKKLIEKIGGLDERYFVWFEEVDYCRQAKNAGFRVMYTPVVQCIDYVGQSFKLLKRGVTQKYFQDSMLKYFRKSHSLGEYLILKIAWPIGNAITLAADVLKIKGRGRT